MSDVAAKVQVEFPQPVHTLRGDDPGVGDFVVTINKNNTHANALASITADGVYQMLVGFAASLEIDIAGFGPRALRATAETNALVHEADIAKVKDWLVHTKILLRAFTTVGKWDPRIALR